MDQSATYWDRINRAVEKESMPDLTVYNDLVYKALKLWLKEKAVRLESEMFKALLSASRKVALSYLSSGSEDMAASCESSFSATLSPPVTACIQMKSSYSNSFQLFGPH